MNDSEKQTIVFIPRNFIEKGTFMGGMFKIRNAIEGGILAVLIAVPVIQLPLSLTIRIIILNWNRWRKYQCFFNERLTFSQKPARHLPHRCKSRSEK